MSILFYILLASFLESAISFVGVAFSIFSEEKVQKVAHFIVSFAVGALLSVALLDLIPEAAKLGGLERIMPWVLAGMILFFVLEKFLFWYHCHNGVCSVHTYTYLVLWGDFLHNFIDGVTLALAFFVDIKLGIITSLAVVFHEIPQELSDFGILIHGGFSRKKALWYNFLSATSTIIGALATYVLGSAIEPILPFGLALTAGNFIYLAASDLMPELHEKTSFRHSFFQIFFIVAGALLVIAPQFIFHV